MDWQFRSNPEGVCREPLAPTASDLATSLQFQDYRLNGPTGRGKLNSPPRPSPFKNGVVDAAGGHCIADEPDVIYLTL